MVFRETHIKLKDGRDALLRSPGTEDAKEMLDFIIKACGETEFLLKYPEEYDGFSQEQEEDLLNEANNDPDSVMIACFVDGRIAGNCRVAFRTGLKDRHRASVAIALLEEFWGLGIGSEMFREMIRIARERCGVCQMELGFIEGNGRARGLYEKMGFRIMGIQPDAVRLKDGRFLNEYIMVKRL